MLDQKNHVLKYLYFNFDDNIVVNL